MSKRTEKVPHEWRSGVSLASNVPTRLNAAIVDLILDLIKHVAMSRIFIKMLLMKLLFTGTGY